MQDRAAMGSDYAGPSLVSCGELLAILDAAVELAQGFSLVGKALQASRHCRRIFGIPTCITCVIRACRWERRRSILVDQTFQRLVFSLQFGGSRGSLLLGGFQLIALAGDCCPGFEL